MRKKRALIIGLFDMFYYYSIRTKYLVNILENAGYKVTIITSDFNHRTKEKYKDVRQNTVQMHILPYRKNMSLGRIVSLIKASYDIKKKADEFNADLVYICGPPNTQFKSFSKYKKKHPKALIGIEIGDMWPESLPVNGKTKKILSIPLRFWANLRDNNLNVYDFVITECKLFEKMVSDKVPDSKLHTIYFCKDELTVKLPNTDLSIEEIHLGYLGSVNNIIDINLISNVVKEVSKTKKTCFHLIGGGEKKNDLKTCITKSGVDFVDHGIVYDDAKKAQILSACKFAFNVMKDGVTVGMAMKSLDYFQYGVPILNSIKGDTWDLIKSENTGLNFDYDSISLVTKRICTMGNDEWHIMKNNALKVFQNNFSTKSFEEKITRALYL